MSILITVLHIGDGGQASIWLLGFTTGFVLAFGVDRLVQTRR